MKYALILIFVCIAVSFVGCDARPTAPPLKRHLEPEIKFSSYYLEDGTRCVVMLQREADWMTFKADNFDCDWKDKARKR